MPKDDTERLADTAFMVEALAAYAGPKIESHHVQPVWELIADLAAGVGRTPAEYFVMHQCISRFALMF